MTTVVVDKLSVTAGDKQILSDVSLSLAAGEFVALLGPNGSGKTTLLRAILGLVRPNRGSVLLDGEPTSRLSARQRAARVAWLPQHAVPEEPLFAEELVAAARFRFRESHARSLDRARSVLAELALSELARRPVTELSGGERQRVALAALLAQDAPCLLTDEPANHLDPAQQLEAYRLLGQCFRQGRSVLAVSHDVNLLRVVPDAEKIRVLGLSQGRLRFETSYLSPDLPAHLSELWNTEVHVLDAPGGRLLVPLPLARGERAP